MSEATRSAGTWDIKARRELVRPKIRQGVEFRKQSQLDGDVQRPPGPNSAAMLVKALIAPGPQHELMEQMARDFSPMAHFRLQSEHAYLLTDPDAIYEALHTNGRHLMKGRALAYAMPLLGKGLVTNDGADHLRQRRLIQPAFHRERIDAYANQMVHCAMSFQSEWVDGNQIDMVTNMHALTFNIAGRTLFGADLLGESADVGTALADAMESFMQALNPLGMILSRLPTKANRNLTESSDKLDAIVQRLIDEHRTSHTSDDLLGMLISAQEEGFEMNDAQLRDEAMTLLLAGHETTAMALTWCWYLLAQNPAARRRLQAEVDDALGDDLPGLADLARLPFAQACIAESMRLYPPAWVIGRRTTKDLEIAGWQIPAGSLILASQYAMHRHPKYWDSPLAFKPERWINEGGEFDETAPGQPKGAWFPFAYGTRRCIGDQFAWTEGTLVLATLSRRWEFSLIPGTSVKPDPKITLRPDGPIPMVVHRRAHAV